MSMYGPQMVSFFLELSCFHVCGGRNVPVGEEPAVKSAPLPMMPCAVTDSAAVAARWAALYYKEPEK